MGFQWAEVDATLVFKMNEWGPFTSGIQTHKRPYPSEPKEGTSLPLFKLILWDLKCGMKRQITVRPVVKSYAVSEFDS